MFKKTFIVVMAFILLLGPVCFAENNLDSDKKIIGIFLEASDTSDTYVNNEKVRELIPQEAEKLFPKPIFDILPMERTQMEMHTYRENSRMVYSNNYVQPLNREDLQKISKELGCDYALFISISNSQPISGARLFNNSFETTITCDVRLLNIETGRYIASEQIMKNGETTTVISGEPSFEEAYNDAIIKALSEIKIDTAAL